MASRQSCIPLFITLVIVSLLFIPASAAGAGAPPSDSTTAIRQAHLEWTALQTDVEMNTAIMYCTTLFGTDTSNMTGFLAGFRNEESLIPSATDPASLDTITADLRSITSQFRNETIARMTKGQGDWDTLNKQISGATNKNPYIAAKEDTYWNTRKTTLMGDFDAWILQGQQALDTLKNEGYDTTGAQRSLDLISFHRPDVVAALGSRNELKIQSMNSEILSMSQQFGQQVDDVQGQVSDDTTTGFLIDQGYRAVARADTINYNLTVILLDISPADSILAQTKKDLASARALQNNGNFESAKTPLRLVKKDLADLAGAYRDLEHSADLPPDLSASLGTMAGQLDNMTVQMGRIV